MSWDIGRYGDVVKKDGAYNVLVVGAGSGIGKAAAGFLAAQGATVICADRDKAGAEAAAKAIGSRASALALDITDDAATRKAVAAAEKKAGHFHAVVNCAGITGRTNLKGHEVDLADFDVVHRINLRGALVLSQAVLPGMLARHYGRILHVASIAGKEGNAGMTAYSATKAGLIGMVKSLGKDYAGNGRHHQRAGTRGHPHTHGGCVAGDYRQIHDRQDPDAPLRRTGRSGGDDRLDHFAGLQLHHRLHLRSVGRPRDLLMRPRRPGSAAADGSTRAGRGFPATGRAHCLRSAGSHPRYEV